MCGICGVIDLEFKKQLDPNIVLKMTDKLLHRGPDGTNYFLNENITLGFSRLSIIDLKTGMQPIFNENRSIVVICNGEIFNYIELSAELTQKGHVFCTNTDIEVIVHLYEEYDVDFLNKMNGQFGFVLYDMNKQKLICARDHFGIVPFYYTVHNSLLIFSSEIKGILEYPGIKKEIDLVGLDQVLSFPGLISPRTMFKNIYSLENGHLLLIENESIKNIEYWDLIYPCLNEINYIQDEMYYTERLFELLKNSVRLRLRADVPVGCYISGGLDSSIITSLVRYLFREQELHTFSIGFADSELSEVEYQRVMASHVKSNHHEIMFNFNDIIGRLKKVIYHCECPVKETYNTASLALSKRVRDQQVKVVLTGEGADELFAGYIGYKFDKFRNSKNKLKNDSLLEKEMQDRIWGDSEFFYEKDIYKFTDIKRRLYSGELRSEFDEINCFNHSIINKDRVTNRDLIHKRSYIDYKLRLVDHLVADHGDRMGLANSVEMRFPFLDVNLMEFAATIPTDLLLKGYEEKYILRKMAKERNLIPQVILNREKFAFVAHGSPHLLKQNIEYINDLLSYDAIKRQGVFDPAYIEELKKQYIDKDFKLNIPYDTDLLIVAITFGILLEEFNIKTVV